MFHYSIERYLSLVHLDIFFVDVFALLASVSVLFDAFVVQKVVLAVIG